MRNKKLLMLLATAMLASSLGLGTILASAGTVESKPAGDGVLTSSNELNLTNFKTIEVNEGDANAYVAENVTDHVVKYNAGEWQGMQVGTPVPKELMAKPDAKVSLVYKFTGLNADAAQFKLVPGASSIEESNTYGLVLTGSNNGIVAVGNERTSATSSDPHAMLKYPGQADADVTAAGENGVGWLAYSWSCATFKTHLASYNNAYFRMDMTVNANGWVDVELIGGFFSEWDRWVETTSVVTNWAPYDGTHDFYANAWARYADGLTVDGAKLSVSYTEEGATKTDVIFDNNMDANVDVSAATAGKFIATGATHAQNGTSGLKVTNPALGTGIMTRAALQTDKGLANNFELNAQLIPIKLAAGQKVGFGFGFQDNMEIAGAHSFFYFTASEDGKVLVGAESVAADGQVTTLIPDTEVVGATIGENAAAIPVSFAGKGANMEVTVGDLKATLENCNPDGFFAITHKGEGEVIYKLKDNLTMKGYRFIENEEGAVAISSNFSGGYINTDKFQFASTVAPDYHMVATDNSHELTGITPEDGKVGFYGTSTNTRIITAKKYADFVMQFDYISVPTQERGALTMSGNRPSGAYIMFGMKEGGLQLIDPSVYAIGMVEGIAAIDFYGNNETVVSTLGMATTCSGIPAIGMAQSKPATEKSDISIPEYTTAYDPNAADNGVKAWHDPDTASIYSMYNKTTRVKLVCLNNEVALYMAEVDTTTGAIKGDYIEIMKFKAVDTEGYVGIGTDSPAYFELDNLAITPISREAALAGTTISADVVPDIAPADMANDPMPTPIAKPVLAVNAEAKKVTWAAVEGAKDYEVSVKLGTETVLEKTVTATEIDLSSLTAQGTYRVTVVANPSNTAEHLSSRESIDYVIGSATSDTPDTPDTPSQSASDSNSESSSASDGSCFGAVGSTMAMVAVAGMVLAISRKRKED